MQEIDPKPSGCPFHQQTAPSGSFSIIDVLGGFARLERRSATLDGSIIARSAACKPFLDGNEAGLHVRLGDSVVLSRDEAEPAVRMTDDHYALMHGNYAGVLDHMVQQGLLIENGFWYERLREGGVIRRDGVISIWTGLLAKPSDGLWLLSTGVFNRRAEVNVRESVIASSEGYTPLIIEFETASMLKDTMWFETELACLVPIQPGTAFSRGPLEQRPELGAILNDFYGSGYLDLRGAGKSVGRYRKLVATDSVSVPEPGTAQCHLAHVSGSDKSTIEFFENLVGPSGPLPQEVAERLPFAVLRSSLTVDFDFDGVRVHVQSGAIEEHSEELVQAWSDLYGKENASLIDWMGDYVLETQKNVTEPIVLVSPVDLVQTPPGWWTLVDGYHYPGLDGMRGAVATDVFPHVAPAFNFRRAGDFHIEEGAPLARLLPVPRHLLEARYELIEIPQTAAAV